MSTTETESAATPPIPAPSASVWGPPPGPPAEVLHGGGSAAPTRQWLPAVSGPDELAAGLIAADLLVGGGAGYAIGHSASAGDTVPRPARPGGRGARTDKGAPVASAARPGKGPGRARPNRASPGRRGSRVSRAEVASAG